MTAGPAFLVGDAVVQDLPHETTEPMGDRADRLRVSETDDQPSIHELKDTAFGLHRGIRRLIEQAAHLPVAVRRSMAVIDAGALIVPGQAPTHEARRLAVGNVAAVGPTSAMICCAESTPKPGTAASRSTAS